MKTKVLHVLHHSLPVLADGYAIRSHSLMCSQQQHGIEVVALTGLMEADAPKSVIDGVRYLRTETAEAAAKFRGIRPFIRYRALAKRLDQIIRQEEPDVIHVHSPVYNGLAAVHAGARYQIPVVYEMRALWEDAAVDRRTCSSQSLFYKAARTLETYVLHRADAVVPICEGLRDEILSRGIDPGKIFIVPNAVRPERFMPATRNDKLAESIGINNGVVFGFIGSLFTYEGVEDLLDAAPAVLDRFPDVQFLIVGGGEREAQVRERIANWPQKNRIIYRPRVPHNEVEGYYSLIHCLVYPRRSVRLTELVTPLKPLEAMAMGKTVIASDIRGHRELIQNDITGLLYNPAGQSALADILSLAAGDASLRTRLAAAGRDYILEQRTWSHVIEGHFAAYRGVLRTKHGRANKVLAGAASGD